MGRKPRKPKIGVKKAPKTALPTEDPSEKETDGAKSTLVNLDSTNVAKKPIAATEENDDEEMAEAVKDTSASATAIVQGQENSGEIKDTSASVEYPDSKPAAKETHVIEATQAAESAQAWAQTFDLTLPPPEAGTAAAMTPPSSPVKMKITPSQKGSPRKPRPVNEPVDVIKHAIRPFGYLARNPQAVDRPASDDAAERHPCDPWSDFTFFDDGDLDPIPSPYEDQLPAYHVKLQSDQFANLAGDPTKWFTDDQLAFYTWWTERKTSIYNDSDSAFFSFYLPPGVQAAIYHGFSDANVDEPPVSNPEYIRFIWRAIHPPSYFLCLEQLATATGQPPTAIDKNYAMYAKLFKDTPMSFNIFSKRVISFIVGTGQHWTPLFVFHPGEVLMQEQRHGTRSADNRPVHFNCSCDSLGQGTGRQTTETKFVVYLMEIIFEIEKWITVQVNLPPDTAMTTPGFISMIENAYRRVYDGTSLFMKPFLGTPTMYLQPDGYNCGPMSVINIAAAYVADAHYNQKWTDIKSPQDFFKLVLEPYWGVCRGGKKQSRELQEKLAWFRYNFISLSQRLSPSPEYRAEFDQEKPLYRLLLRTGQYIESREEYVEVKHFLMGYDPNADRAGAFLDDIRAKAVAEEAEAEAKVAEEAEAMAEKTKATAGKAAATLSPLSDSGTDTEDGKPAANEGQEPPRKKPRIHLKLPSLVGRHGGELAGIEQELAKLERQPLSPHNKRLRDVLLKKRTAGLDQREQTKRIEARKKIKDKWRGESKDWRTNPKDMLRGVESEMSLGPKKEVLEALNDLDETMMEEEDYDETKVLSCLEGCFPVTASTGEVKDKAVAEVSHLKYIPTHIEGIHQNSHVYQGLTDGKLVDLINPNWVRWCFEQDYCMYVMRLGLAQWKKYKDRTRLKWVPVPLGASRDGGMIRELLVKSVPLKYPQYDLETCTFMSMASALHYCAATLKMGEKQMACTLASGAPGYVRGKNARAQLDLLVKLIKEKSPYYKKYELRAKESKVAEWDILNSKNMWPTLVVLRGADGGQSHSVTIVNGLVFDSNCSNAMSLSKATLDWCCNCVGGFQCATYAVRFWH
jgi:hypothetical protein